LSTGYSSKAALIGFICILCEGKIETINKRVSSLTWFEEWLTYFQIIWGKHVTRWDDIEYQFNSSTRSLGRIFDSKQAIHLHCRRRWPIFVNFDEDAKLRKEYWNDEYAGKRLIMWDNTDVNIYQPSDADNQRNTYSSYYGGNRAKGAVFIQPCGWAGTHMLYPGAIGDSEYMIRSGAITMHDKYLHKYDDNNKHIKFHMMLDKGYRITSQAWEAGGQIVIQPNFATSDEQFTAFETMRSAAVAADRSGNERAVHYMKGCGFIDGGLRPGEKAQRLENVWLCWGFMTNFMYKPVL
jgi:hypothetical protein